MGRSTVRSGDTSCAVSRGLLSLSSSLAHHTADEGSEAGVGIASSKDGAKEKAAKEAMKAIDENHYNQLVGIINH